MKHKWKGYIKILTIRHIGNTNTETHIWIYINSKTDEEKNKKKHPKIRI